MPKNKLPKIVRQVIEYALEHADMEREGCAVAEEHKEALRLYLDTWVRGPLFDVLEWDEGKATITQLAVWVSE